jgi:hypothetical protein
MQVILILSGIVERVIEADSVARAQQVFPNHLCIERTPPLAHVGPGFTTADGGNTFTAPAPVTTIEDRRVTKRSFWNRFPEANETVMRGVMLGGSPVLLAATLSRLQVRVEASPWVDLDLPETRGGVQSLASASVPITVTLDGVTLPMRLTPAQVAAVLDAPIQHNERYVPATAAVP